jgi:hypothetical protein
MSDTYSNDSEPDPGDVAEPGETSEPGEGTKQSQEQANYREGNPQRSCGLCGHFDSKGHSCDVVEGDISPFGFSDLYLRQDNPFRTGEKEGFKGGTKVAVVAPAAAVPAAPLRIGRKTYGG